MGKRGQKCVQVRSGHPYCYAGGVDALRWRQIKAVLETAIETAPADRAAYLKEATGDDNRLRREVESLLEHDGQDGVLDRSPVPPMPTGATGVDPLEPSTPVCADQVDLVDLPPYSRVTVWTRRTRYELVVVAPLNGELIVHGGERFPQPITAFLLGRQTIAGEHRMTLQIGGRRVTTSRVDRVEVH